MSEPFTVNNSIQKEVKCTRQLLGLTQGEFAKILGVTSKTVSNYEVGGDISRDIAARIYIELSEYLDYKEKLNPTQISVLQSFLPRMKEYYKQA